MHGASMLLDPNDIGAYPMTYSPTFMFHAAFLCSDCVGRTAVLSPRIAQKPWMHRDLLDAITKARADFGIPDGATDTDRVPEYVGHEGGGEADCPQHCDTCGKFLRNPLTPDGENYVVDAIEQGDGDAEILAAWRDEYSYLFD